MRSGWCVVVAAVLILPPQVLWGVPFSQGASGERAGLRLARADALPRLAPLVAARDVLENDDADAAPLPQLALLVPPRQLLEPAPEAETSEPQDAPPPLVEETPEEEAEERPEPLVMEAPDGPPTRNEICAMLEAEANVRALPAVFFVRLIWQESRFKIKARSHKGAQGIAQFMPATAKERGLHDPSDPVAAIGASAEFLSELAESFGNVGLAAAAYNAGPGRVQRWLDGKSSLPRETRHYVEFVTGRKAEDWKNPDMELPRALFDGIESVQAWCRVFHVHPPKKIKVQEPVPDLPVRADKPWGVQIAAGNTEETAQTLLAEAKAEHGEILGEHEPAVVRRREPGRGRDPVYAVRIALDTREAADALCSRFKENGGVCTVGKNTPVNH